MITYMRWRVGEPRESSLLPVMDPSHPAAHLGCPVCGEKLANGKRLRLLALGPDEYDSRVKCADGGWFSARAIALHTECLGMGIA